MGENCTMLLMSTLFACQPGADGVNTEVPAETEQFDPGAAALTVTIANMHFETALPVSLFRVEGEGERVIAQGTTGQPIEVGVGSVEIRVGPHTFPSASGLDYYPTLDDEYTEDGLPIIFASERRYVLQRTTIDIDQAEETVDTTFVGVVGEGTYKCMWDQWELDEDAWDKRGDHVTSMIEEFAEAEPPILADSIIGWIGMQNGRTLVPDPASPLANYGGIFQPEDTLVIEPTPSGRYPSNIALDSPIGNEILSLDDMEGTGVKGSGLNNFEVYYVDRRAERTTYLYCWYDWTDFAETVYESQQ